MGADATLVNMAYKAALAKSPGSWSASFDEQYKGIIAANKAATLGLSKAVAGATGGILKAYTQRRAIEKVQEQAIKNAQELYKLKDDAGTSLLQSSAANNTYANGEGLNKGFQEAGYSVPDDIYNNITKINKKLFKSKKDKQKIAEEYARLERWKADRITDKANVKEITTAVNEGLINVKNMDPDFKGLWAQLIDRQGDFSLKGIKVYNRKSDDKLMIEFTPDRLEAEHEYNKRMQDPDVDPSVLPSIKPYSGETAQAAGVQTISFQELVDNAKNHYKKVEERTAVGNTRTGALDKAALRDPNSKTFKFTTEAAHNQIKKELTDVIKGGGVISDLATADLFGSGKTYRDHLTSLVHEDPDLLRAMGVKDEGEPGYQDDLHGSSAKELLKEEIIARLINPKNPDDLRFAEENMLEYFISDATKQFDDKRKEIMDAEAADKKTRKGTRYVSIEESNAAKGLIDAAQDAGFTIESLQSINLRTGFDIIEEDVFDENKNPTGEKRIILVKYNQSGKKIGRKIIDPTNVQQTRFILENHAQDLLSMHRSKYVAPETVEGDDDETTPTTTTTTITTPTPTEFPPEIDSVRKKSKWITEQQNKIFENDNLSGEEKQAELNKLPKIQ